MIMQYKHIPFCAIFVSRDFRQVLVLIYYFFQIILLRLTEPFDTALDLKIKTGKIRNNVMYTDTIWNRMFCKFGRSRSIEKSNNLENKIQ